MKCHRVRVVRTTRDGAMLKWADPDDGRQRQRQCSGTTSRQFEDERRQLEQQLNRTASGMTWPEFWDLYQAGHLALTGARHQKKVRMMARRLEAAAGDALTHCDQITAELVFKVELAMQLADAQAGTIDSAMKALWSILHWGQDRGLIDPQLTRPRRRAHSKRDRQRARAAKGRSLSGEEFDRLIAAIPKVVKPYEQPDGFVAAAHAMRLIGLRLTEAWLLAWEPGPERHYVTRLDRPNPGIVFTDVQKSGGLDDLPLTPEAAAWLRQRQRAQSGPQRWICRTSGARGQHATSGRLGKVISLAGRRAGIVVKRWTRRDGSEKVKCASSHDLRRTFASELQQRLSVPELQQMTRLASPQTLLDYYVEASTPEIYRKLYAAADRPAAGG